MMTVASERYSNKGEVGGRLADDVKGGKWITKRSVVPGVWVVRHIVVAQGSPTDFEPPLLYEAKTRVIALGRKAAQRRGEDKLSQPPKR